MVSFLFCTFVLTVLGLCLGIVLRMSIRSKARDSLMRLALASTSCAAAIVALVLRAPPWVVPSVAASAFLAIGLVTLYVRQHRHTLTGLRDVAPALRDFGLRHFDRLAGSKGVITLADLIVIEQQEPGPGDRDMIRLMRHQLPQIGHCIDWTVIVGTTGGPAIPVYHYGISREDLEKYPAKAQADYDEEFGKA